MIIIRVVCRLHSLKFCGHECLDTYGHKTSHYWEKLACRIRYTFELSTYLGMKTFLEWMKALLDGNCKLAAILLICV